MTGPRNMPEPELSCLSLHRYGYSERWNNLPEVTQPVNKPQSLDLNPGFPNSQIDMCSNTPGKARFGDPGTMSGGRDSSRR